METRGKRFPDKLRSDHLPHITALDLPIFEALNLHGPLPSVHLNHFHGNRDHSHTLKRLRAHSEFKLSGYNGAALKRPTGQRYTENPNAKFIVHDLAPVGKQELQTRGKWVEAIRPSGTFSHQLMTACITASIHIGAKERGIEYIPGHVILERAGATLAAPLGAAKLIPDQLFQLKYPDGSYATFVVEADRCTEGVSDTGKDRKTYESAYRLYERFIGSQLYRQHYKIKSKLKVLNVLAKPTRVMSYMNVIPDCSYMLFNYVEGFTVPLKVPPVWDLSTWSRRGYKDFNIFDY